MPRHVQSLFVPGRSRKRYLPRAHRWVHAKRRGYPDPGITRLQLEYARLSRDLRGFRILHLSDIHHGLFYSPARLERVIELSNQQAPDFIALTGDFVTQSAQFIEPVCRALADLRARRGVYAVLGNHDFRAGAETITQALERRQIHVLRNRYEWLRVGRAKLLLAGMDDARQHPSLAGILQPVPRGADFSLLLAHNPRCLRAAARHGMDLVLSGHTHGGQIKPPFARPLYRRMVAEGLLREGKTRMYVSRGLGQVILPWRWGCPPEIAVLELESVPQ